MAEVPCSTAAMAVLLAPCHEGAEVTGHLRHLVRQLQSCGPAFELAMPSPPPETLPVETVEGEGAKRREWAELVYDLDRAVGACCAVLENLQGAVWDKLRKEQTSARSLDSLHSLITQCCRTILDQIEEASSNVEETFVGMTGKWAPPQVVQRVVRQLFSELNPVIEAANIRAERDVDRVYCACVTTLPGAGSTPTLENYVQVLDSVGPLTTEQIVRVASERQRRERLPPCEQLHPRMALDAIATIRRFLENLRRRIRAEGGEAATDKHLMVRIRDHLKNLEALRRTFADLQIEAVEGAAP